MLFHYNYHVAYKYNLIRPIMLPLCQQNIINYMTMIMTMTMTNISKINNTASTIIIILYVFTKGGKLEVVDLLYVYPRIDNTPFHV